MKKFSKYNKGKTVYNICIHKPTNNLLNVQKIFWEGIITVDHIIQLLGIHEITMW